MKAGKILTSTIMFILMFSIFSIVDTASGEVHIQKLHGVVYEKTGTRAAGEPVPGAEVYVEQEPNDPPWAYSNSTTTGDDGSYEIFLPNGTFKVTVKKAGYESSTIEIVVKAGEDLEKDLVLVKKGESLSVEMSCEGTVMELKPGETCTFRIRIRNTGIKTDSYKVDISGENQEWASMGTPMLTRSAGGGGPYSQSVSNLEDNGIVDIDVNVTAPEDAEPGDYEFTLKTTSTSDPEVEDELNITVTVLPDTETGEDDESTPGPGILMFVLSFLLVSLIALSRRNERD